jgi:hypothetical protein
MLLGIWTLSCWFGYVHNVANKSELSASNIREFRITGCYSCFRAVATSRVTDHTLVFASIGMFRQSQRMSADSRIISDLIPRHNRSWTRVCLYSDAKAVKAKLNELTAAEDEVAKAGWIEERRKVVQTRHQVRLFVCIGYPNHS